jgi:hypothetical protein
VEESDGQSQRRGQNRVERHHDQLLVEGEQEQDHHPAEQPDAQQVAARHRQHVAEEQVRQVRGVVAHGGDNRDAEREHPGEHDSDGRVLPYRRPAREGPHAQRGQRRGAQGPPEHRAPRPRVQHIADRHARQDRVREGVAQEGQAAQHDKRPNHRTDDPDEDHSTEPGLHERIAQRLGEELEQVSHAPALQHSKCHRQRRRPSRSG